jgi:hypothetical protein
MNEVALSCLHSKRQSEFAVTEQGNEFLLDQEISAPCGWLWSAPHLVRPTQKSLFQWTRYTLSRSRNLVHLRTHSIYGKFLIRLA